MKPLRSWPIVLTLTLFAVACDSGTDLADPGPGPEGVEVEYVDGQLVVDWDEVAGADSYNLYWDHEDSAAVLELDTARVRAGVAAPHTFAFPGVHGAESVTRYWFTVTAVVDGVESEPSEVVMAGVFNGFIQAMSAVESVLLSFRGACTCGAESTADIWWATGEESIEPGEGEHIVMPYHDLPLIHEGLSPDSTYQYAVILTNEWGTSRVYNAAASPASSTD